MICPKKIKLRPFLHFYSRRQLSRLFSNLANQKTGTIEKSFDFSSVPGLNSLNFDSSGRLLLYSLTNKGIYLPAIFFALGLVFMINEIRSHFLFRSLIGKILSASLMFFFLNRGVKLLKGQNLLVKNLYLKKCGKKIEFRGIFSPILKEVEIKEIHCVEEVNKTITQLFNGEFIFAGKERFVILWEGIVRPVIKDRNLLFAILNGKEIENIYKVGENENENDFEYIKN